MSWIRIELTMMEYYYYSKWNMLGRISHYQSHIDEVSTLDLTFFWTDFGRTILVHGHFV